MWYLKHVFGILTLQTATILLSAVYIVRKLCSTLSLCVLFVNVLAVDADSLMAWIVMLFLILFLVVIWSMAFNGAYKESHNIMEKATVLWTVYLLVWVAVVVVSLLDLPKNKNLCLQTRCPYALWLTNSPGYNVVKYQRYLQLTNPRYVYGKTLSPSIRPIYEKTINLQSNWNELKEKPMKLKMPDNTTVNSDDTYENDGKQLLYYYVHQITPTTSIIISLVYTLLLVFSWLVLKSYRKEIQSQTTVAVKTN